jgi:uncharacterized protein YeeX (DUF496 family)
LTAFLFLFLTGSLSAQELTREQKIAIITCERELVAQDTVIDLLRTQVATYKEQVNILVAALNDGIEANTLSKEVREDYEARIADLTRKVAGLEKEIKTEVRKKKFWKTVAIAGPVVTVLLIKIL